MRLRNTHIGVQAHEHGFPPVGLFLCLYMVELSLDLRLKLNNNYYFKISIIIKIPEKRG